jgi:hypothetical protein
VPALVSVEPHQGLGEAHHGEMLKLEITLIAKVIPRLGQLDSHDIFDPNSKFTVGIISWFVGDDVSSLKCGFVVVRFWTYSLWSFVDIEERTDPVTGAMSVI